MEAFKCKIHIYLVERQVLCTYIYMCVCMFDVFTIKEISFHFILSLMFYDCSLTLLFHILWDVFYFFVVAFFYFLNFSIVFSIQIIIILWSRVSVRIVQFNVPSYFYYVVYYVYVSKANITFHPYIACLLRHVFKMMICTNYNKSQQGGSYTRK